MIELQIDEAEGNFLEYERHLTRTIAEAFGGRAQKSPDFRADVLSPLYQAAIDSLDVD